jgi:hypothetical protein
MSARSARAAWSMLVALVAGWIGRWRRRRRLPGRTLIISPRESTVVSADGSVRSVQTAHLALPSADLDRLWKRANLENLARTYWRFLTRVTLGAIRVRYGTDERRVVLLFPPITLLRFSSPEYEVAADLGRVTWRIRDGLLVARAGRDGSGFLCLEVQRQPAVGDGSETAILQIQVEVANFYPSIASGFSTLIYEATQSFVHVLVTHAFLRSLATLELAETRVGALADP